MPLPFPERFNIKYPFFFWIAGPPLLIIRMIMILIFLILMTSVILLTGLIRRISGREMRRARNLLHHMAGVICIFISGGRVIREGSPPPEGSMMVSDHRSWLDALIYLSIKPATFIVTKDSSSWPLIGFLIKSLGNIYINKDSIEDVKKIMEAVEESLVRGDSVIFFPEATTIDGETEKSLPFKSSLFEAAVRLNKPVYCGALEYRTCRGWPRASRIIAWGDWTPFPLHVIRVLMIPRFFAELHYIKTPVASDNRKVMAQKAQSLILKELEIINKSKKAPRREP